MLNVSQRLRAPLALAALAAGAVATTASPALASEYGASRPIAPTEFSCTVPTAGAQLTTFTGSYMFWAGGDTSRPVHSNSKTFLEGTPPQLVEAARAAGATQVEVTGSWTWKITTPSGATSSQPAGITAGTYAVDTWTGKISAVAAPPSIALPLEAGTYSWGLEGLSYVVRATDAAGAPVDLSNGTDGDADPATTTIPCAGSIATAGGTSVDLAAVKPVIDRVETTPTSATIYFKPEVGSSRWLYIVFDGNTQVANQVGNGPITISGLTPGSMHVFTAVASTVSYGSPTSDPVTVRLPMPTPPVRLNGAGNLNIKGSLVGRATSQVVVNGTLNPATGTLDGTTAIAPAFGTMTALGVLPIKVALGFTPVGATTGTSPAEGGFTVTTTQDIAIKSASFLGIRIATGTCHTATPPAITLTSSSAGASFRAGGTASGQFNLGKLTGCSSFGSIIGTNGGRGTLSTKFFALTQLPIPPSI